MIKYTNRITSIQRIYLIITFKFSLCFKNNFLLILLKIFPLSSIYLFTFLIQDYKINNEFDSLLIWMNVCFVSNYVWFGNYAWKILFCFSHLEHVWILTLSEAGCVFIGLKFYILLTETFEALQISRTTVKYQVSVFTADESGAGTDANVKDGFQTQIRCWLSIWQK